MMNTLENRVGSSCKKNVAVVFGGASPEHFVSCSSAASLISAINEDEWNVYRVGITRDGIWILTEASCEEIADGKSWLSHPKNRSAILSPDKKNRGLLILSEFGYEVQPLDVVFPIIHGETGEDGCIQGLLEMSGIPYVGSNVCASACAMDKTVSMIFCDLCGIKRPYYYACTSAEYKEAPELTAKKITDYFTGVLSGSIFPLFVKPAPTGSSVGISKVESGDAMMAALANAAEYSDKIIIEQGIRGRELKIAVLGNEDPIVGVPCEVVVNGIFNDYDMKYKTHDTHKKIPAELPKEVGEELDRQAIAIYKIMGCAGFSRVDFFVTDDMEIIFNEINTVPGFTRGSIYPLMFQAAGMEYEQLVAKLLESARG